MSLSRWLTSPLSITVIGNALTCAVFLLAHMLWSKSSPWWFLFAFAVSLPLGLYLNRVFHHRQQQYRNALEVGLLNLKDHDYSTTLPDRGDVHWQRIVRLYNEMGETLRSERQTVYQRELMLDHVMQSSPMAIVLTDDRHNILYSNQMAQELINNGSAMDGENFNRMANNMPATFQTALTESSSIFSMPIDNYEELFHLSQNQFVLNNHYHHLYLCKNLTRELNRQEIDTWKKSIRVISHEINNALAPLSSMAHSGKLLAKDNEQLQKVFNTIAERTAHLNKFIQGYARFAKLPKPNIQEIQWSDFVAGLRQQWHFELQPSLPREKANDKIIFGDAGQLEQVFSNLLKNAEESGSNKEDIVLCLQFQRIDSQRSEVQIDVCDGGSGMSESVLYNALLPFYSTKQSGTGLGLALCREIIEAHNGRLRLANRDQGGLVVSIFLPC